MWSNVSNSYVNIFQRSCDQILFNQSCASADYTDWLVSTVVVQSLTGSHGEHYLSLCWGYPRIYLPAERQIPLQVWRTGGEEPCWSWWAWCKVRVLFSHHWGLEQGPSSSPVPLRLDQLETARARPGPPARPPSAPAGLYYLSPDQLQTNSTPSLQRYHPHSTWLWTGFPHSSADFFFSEIFQPDIGKTSSWSIFLFSVLIDWTLNILFTALSGVSLNERLCLSKPTSVQFSWDYQEVNIYFS